jgi:hypothetical protein
MTTITEDYVSFEIAKLLKEKGFGIKEETRGYYPIKGDATGRLMFGAEYHHNTSQVQIAAPTHQMAMKWLREKHGIYIDISIYVITKDILKYNINVYYKNDSIYLGIHLTKECSKYEQACEAGIKYSLKNLI